MPKGIYEHHPNQFFKKGHKINVGRKYKLKEGDKRGLHMKGKKLTKEWRMNLSKAKKGTMLGKNNPFWKGGEISDGRGYIVIYSPSHPFKNSSGYVRKHRLVMEQKIKRFLTSKECVHHINHNRSDNRISNLKLLPNRKIHSENHRCKKTGRFTP